MPKWLEHLREWHEERSSASSSTCHRDTQNLNLPPTSSLHGFLVISRERRLSRRRTPLNLLSDLDEKSETWWTKKSITRYLTEWNSKLTQKLQDDGLLMLVGSILLLVLAVLLLVKVLTSS